MFKIVKGSTLTTLHRQAAELPGLRQQLDAAERKAIAAQRAAEAARAEAETARGEAELARADLKAIENDRLIGLATLRDAVRDPNRRPSVRGLIAMRILRDQVETAKAEAARTGTEIPRGLLFLAMVLCEGDDDGTEPNPDRAEPQAGRRGPDAQPELENV